MVDLDIRLDDGSTTVNGPFSQDGYQTPLEHVEVVSSGVNMNIQATVCCPKTDS